MRSLRPLEEDWFVMIGIYDFIVTSEALAARRSKSNVFVSDEITDKPTFFSPRTHWTWVILAPSAASLPSTTDISALPYPVD